MKRNSRLAVTILIVAALLIGIAGCGKKSAGDTTNNTTVTVNDARSSVSAPEGSAPADNTSAKDAAGNKTEKDSKDNNSSDPSKTDKSSGPDSSTESTGESQSTVPQEETEYVEEVVIELEEGQAGGGM